MKTIAERRQELKDILSEIKDHVTGHKLNVDLNDVSDVIAIFANYIVSMTDYLSNMQLRYRNTFNVKKAVGSELRDVVSYLGIQAKAAKATATDVTFTGAPGVNIPYCHILSEDGNKDFIYTGGGTIGEDGRLVVNCEAAEAGEILLSDNELVKTEPTIPGVIITNNNIVIGSEAETDNELHLRVDRMQSTIGFGFFDIIDSALMDLDGVRSATTFADDPDKGIPYGTITSVVAGGNNEEIAQTIFSKNIFLYGYTGNTAVTVQSDRGNEYEVRFTRPQTKPLFMKLRYEFRNPDEEIPQDKVIDKIYSIVQPYLLLRQPSSRVYIADIMALINEQAESFVVMECLISFNQEEIQNVYEDIPWDSVLEFPKENLKLMD